MFDIEDEEREQEFLRQCRKTIDARVEQGAKVLDELVPGWYNRIALNILDLSSCYRCALGQLFGDFHKGTPYLMVHVKNRPEIPIPTGLPAVDLGFDIESGHSVTGVASDDFNMMTEAWTLEVEKRRANA